MRSVSTNGEKAKDLINTANSAYGNYQDARSKANNSLGGTLQGVGQAAMGVGTGALMLPEPSGATKVFGLGSLGVGAILDVVGGSMNRKAESRANQALMAANEANSAAQNELIDLDNQNSASIMNNSGGMQFARGVDQTYVNTNALREDLKPLPMN